MQARNRVLVDGVILAGWPELRVSSSYRASVTISTLARCRQVVESLDALAAFLERGDARERRCLFLVGITAIILIVLAVMAVVVHFFRI